MHITLGNAAIVQLSYFQEEVSKAQWGSCLPLVLEEELVPQLRAHLWPRLHEHGRPCKAGRQESVVGAQGLRHIGHSLSLDPQDGQQPVL